MRNLTKKQVVRVLRRKLHGNVIAVYNDHDNMIVEVYNDTQKYLDDINPDKIIRFKNTNVVDCKERFSFLNYNPTY